jgi:hypothetical protein
VGIQWSHLPGLTAANISNWPLSSELEVVGVNQVHPLPDLVQHVEQPK